MNAAKASLLALALASGTAAADDLRIEPGVGFAWLAQEGARGARDEAAGVALELRVEGRLAPRTGVAMTLTWGLTDWDRAREYVDAGNRAGSWTTEKLADVEAWATKKDARQDTRGLRYVGAFFADLFLVMTYAAVPACYVGSVGGATSHLQVDVTGSLHLADGGPTDAWVELGLGAAALPHRADWRRALGPVAGAGVRVGRLRLGARVLWSPPVLNSAVEPGPVLAGALTLAVDR